MTEICFFIVGYLFKVLLVVNFPLVHQFRFLIVEVWLPIILLFLLILLVKLLFHFLNVPPVFFIQLID